MKDHNTDTSVERCSSGSPKLRWIGVGVGILVILAVLLLLMNRSNEDGTWQQYRRELEAKGEKLEWEAFIPPTIPDEQNFLKAPAMTAWFSRQAWQSNRVALFELPAWIQTRPLTLEQLRAIPDRESVSNTPTSATSVSREKLREWFAQVDSEYRLFVVASARPFARLDTDYRNPVTMDIPSFVNQRNVAQALATHASLSVLDGRGDVAIQDLLIMRRLSDVSASSPTLIGAMIRVAIIGMYTQTAQEMLESRALSSVQIQKIQEQTREVNLVKDFARSLRAERAMQVRMLSLPSAELIKLVRPTSNPMPSPSKPFWQFNWNAWLSDLRLGWNLRSKAWVAANTAFIARAHQDALDQIDLTTPRIHGAAHSLVFSNIQQTLTRSPSYGLAALMMPNYSRALTTAARNQTQLDQFRVACALERYRLKHRAYPEALGALLSDFLDRIPKDLFADQPLQYRRNEQGGYQVWSVGWDEKDDQGTSASSQPGPSGYTEQPGDWVWRNTVTP